MKTPACTQMREKAENAMQASKSWVVLVGEDTRGIGCNYYYYFFYTR